MIEKSMIRVEYTCRDYTYVELYGTLFIHTHNIYISSSYS